MDAIVNVVAEVLLLGSLALLVWGAILTAGQLVRSGRSHRAADEARQPRRGPPAHAARGICLRRAAAASVASYRQHDLADVLRAFHQLVRGARLGEREGLVDEGLELAGLEERPDVAA